MTRLAYAFSVTVVLCLGIPSTGVLAQCHTGGAAYPAGVADNFAAPTEPTAPSSSYLSYMLAMWPQPVTRAFDEDIADLTLIHTFTGWQGPVSGARLEVRVVGGNHVTVSNDGIALELVGGPDHTRAFLYFITFRGILGSWDTGADATIVLDLANLPVSGTSPTNILSALSDGSLDLMISDDSAIDYATLYICQPTVGVQSSRWSHVRGLFR